MISLIRNRIGHAMDSRSHSGTLWVLFLLFVVTLSAVRALEDNKLNPSATYFITAPRQVRPDMDVRVGITILRIPFAELVVTAAIKRNEMEIASLEEVFREATTRIGLMKIPPGAQPGNYSLSVKAYTSSAKLGLYFKNETKLDFQVKYVSIRIETDNWVYYKTSLVKFRVYAYLPNLLPLPHGAVDIFLRDGAGQYVKRWREQQVRNGYLEGKIQQNHPCKHGWWTIEVHGFGKIYTHQYKTENHYPTLYDINITIPEYIYENDFGLAGTVVVNMTQSGIPIHGNATIQLEIRPPGEEDEDNYLWLTKKIDMFTGMIPFVFKMSEIQAVNPDLPGTELVVHAAISDWYGLEYKDDAVAYCFIQKQGYKIEFVGGNVRTFKPGSRFPAYIAVFAEDGTKYNSNYYSYIYISATVRKTTGEVNVIDEEAYIIPDDSIVKYTFQTAEDDQTIELSAAFGDRSKPQYLRATRHYTERNEYIHVRSSTANPRIDNYVIFTVRLSTYVPNVHYMITSAGNIVSSDTLFMNSRQKTFTIGASRNMVPDATIIVYAFLNNGEVIADSLSFHVHGVRNDGVELFVNAGKDFTKDTMELTAKTDASTYVAFNVQDYEFVQRGVNDFLSTYWIEEDLLEYTVNVNTSYKHTWYYDEGIKENVFFDSPSSAIDANETFTYAGLYVFTDANLVRIPGYDLCNYTLGYMPCYTEGSCYHISQKCDGVWQCTGGADEMGCPRPSQIIRKEYREMIYRIWDHMDSRQWAWVSHYTMPNGRIDLTVDVPIRPTTWLLQGIAMSTENGISFNEIPVRLNSVRPFYITGEVPKASFRGEQLGVQIGVFNYYEKPIETILTLADSDDYRFIMGEDHGIVSSYNPRLTRGDIQTMVYLQPGEARFIHFPILPVSPKANVVVIADSNIRKQTWSKEVSVSYDGVTNYYHTPFLIDLINSGSVHIPHLYVPVPERFVVPGQRMHLYVPGSGKCTVSLSGDVAGTGFDIPHLDAPSIFNKMVHGDGQQYLFDLGINMYWLMFLHQVNQLTNDILKGAIDGMNKDMLSVYAFILDGGGMAFRRKKSPMSVWLTSLALDVISQCSYQEWEDYLYIDIPVLNKMALWLVQQQNQTTGAFWETSMNFDHNMRSNLTNEYGQPMNMTLTAYAVVGLMRASEKMFGVAQSAAIKAANAGADYISNNFGKLVSPFEICACTYALYVANHPSRSEAFITMKSIARTENYMYWAEVQIPPQEYIIIDNIPYLYTNYMPYPNQAKAIHGTAFALEVYLMNNNLEESVPIMKWLQTQRFYEQGFHGTQDTLAAVRALTKFAERQTNREFYNMLVELVATSSPDWAATFHMERGQVHGYETSSIPNVWGSIASAAEGSGYALLQMKTQVNVEYPQLMRQPQIRAFDLEIDYLRFSGRNASLFEMNICITWVATQYGDRSGSVILEVDIPTGWFVRKQQLRIYQRVSRIQSQRSRFTKQKVVLFMDYIDTNRTCWYFPAERHLPVANGSIQHMIRVQDSYEPAFHNTTLFNTWDLYHLHICQVCGSFQCPYCPHYNGSCPTGVSYPLWILIALMYLTPCFGCVVR